MRLSSGISSPSSLGSSPGGGLDTSRDHQHQLASPGRSASPSPARTPNIKNVKPKVDSNNNNSSSSKKRGRSADAAVSRAREHRMDRAVSSNTAANAAASNVSARAAPGQRGDSSEPQQQPMERRRSRSFDPIKRAAHPDEWMSNTVGETSHTSMRYKDKFTKDEHGRVERGSSPSRGSSGRLLGRKSLGGKRTSWVPNTYGESAMPHQDRSFNARLGHTHENRSKRRGPNLLPDYGDWGGLGGAGGEGALTGSVDRKVKFAADSDGADSSPEGSPRTKVPFGGVSTINNNNNLLEDRLGDDNRSMEDEEINRELMR